MHTLITPSDTAADPRPVVLADFFDTHDTDRRWLGTLQGATDPNSLRATATGRQLTEATDPETFTSAVNHLMHASADQDDGLRCHPADGWPWPWNDSRHADWIYLFDGTRVWVAAPSSNHVMTPTALLADPDDALARRTTLLNKLADRVFATPPDQPAGPGRPSRRRSRFDLVHEHVLATADRTRALTDDEIAALAFALADPLVRDASLSFALGEHAQAAENLWGQLVKASPAPERAEPAALLAAFAYLRNDVDLATAALAHARNACPGHRLGELLRETIATGVPAEHLLRMAHHSQSLIDQL
ncbi:DUF4192 domain-containing protein [Saccharothrix syringae]|uniref:DUF4192 family protein n=1 Tax=Saccharothrix syringae TaxID=103733 RepID=A0A5Q0GWR8_SACSY|nr:DUF4192 domain-containing protein [Saccharothrix syringae]QFZ18497.1 DUF4192 family protein [Saccharothrix syringae]